MMVSDDSSKSFVPDLPTYLQDPLKRQSPGQLELTAEYAIEPAVWKRTKRERELAQKRAREVVDDEELEDFKDHKIATDPEEYENRSVNGTYITIKETNPNYHYYYWQWKIGILGRTSTLLQ